MANALIERTPLIFQKVSQAPTNPGVHSGHKAFDVADLYKGPLGGGVALVEALPLDEKLRQAYFWLVNTAIISPYYDVEYSESEPLSYSLGESEARMRLPDGQSYCSFVLLPLLNMVVRRRCLLVGGSGRGKSTLARLMGVLAGYSLPDVRRAVQHGQPQMSIGDLLGRAIPAASGEPGKVTVDWRQWLGLKVKIVDDYNQIPDDTQVALMTVMADNHAELMDQGYDCPEAAWFLTADEPGTPGPDGVHRIAGNLGDRVDVVVKAFPFNTRFLADLLSRLEQDFRAEERVPAEVIFTEADIDAANSDVMKVEVGLEVRQRLEHFFAQFEFCDPASDTLEYQTKETVRLYGGSVPDAMNLQLGKVNRLQPGFQTSNGLSVRTMLTCLVFLKAMAYFRGSTEVTLEDARQVLPLVLHDKLDPILDSKFFEEAQNEPLRTDRVNWIRRLWDISAESFERIYKDGQEETLSDLEAEFAQGLDGLGEPEARRRLQAIEEEIERCAETRMVSGPTFYNLLKLKYLHQRYTNYLRWLLWAL